LQYQDALFATGNRGLTMQTMTFKPETLTAEQQAELLALFSLTPAELAGLRTAQ
jgi:hypothetical protein